MNVDACQFESNFAIGGDGMSFTSRLWLVRFGHLSSSKGDVGGGAYGGAIFQGPNTNVTLSCLKISVIFNCLSRNGSIALSNVNRTLFLRIMPQSVGQP